MNQMMQMMQAFMKFAQNPAQALGVSPDALKNPGQIIQQLMNNGRITQEQYNQAAAQARQLQQNPQFMQMMQGAFRR